MPEILEITQEQYQAALLCSYNEYETLQPWSDLSMNDLMKAALLSRCEAVINPTPENVVVSVLLNQAARDAVASLFGTGITSAVLAESVFGKRPMFRPTPLPPTAEYLEGKTHAENHGKMKQNPYEGGSVQWWDWHNGYKMQKETEARLARRHA